MLPQDPSLAGSDPHPPTSGSLENNNIDNDKNTNNSCQSQLHCCVLTVQQTTLSISVRICSPGNSVGAGTTAITVSHGQGRVARLTLRP